MFIWELQLSNTYTPSNDLFDRYSLNMGRWKICSLAGRERKADVEEGADMAGMGARASLFRHIQKSDLERRRVFPKEILVFSDDWN